MATKKSVWKLDCIKTGKGHTVCYVGNDLDCIKTGKGHEVCYVGNEEPLMIFHEGHEWSDLSN